MSAAKARSRKSDGTQLPDGELAILALRLTTLASDVKNWQERSGEAERLATRRGTLERYREKLTELVQTLKAMSHVRGMQAARAQAIASLRPQRDAARALATRCAEDPKYVTKAKSVDALKEAELDALAAAVLGAWQTYLGAAGQSGIEVVLARFPQLRETARRVTEARKELQTRASKLPSSEADVEACEACRIRLANVLSQVDSSGIDDAVLAFLKASVSGVSLATVLESEHLVSWMRQHGLAAQFTVRSL